MASPTRKINPFRPADARASGPQVPDYYSAAPTGSQSSNPNAYYQAPGGPSTVTYPAPVPIINGQLASSPANAQFSSTRFVGASPMAAPPFPAPAQMPYQPQAGAPNMARQMPPLGPSGYPPYGPPLDPNNMNPMPAPTTGPYAAPAPLQGTVPGQYGATAATAAPGTTNAADPNNPSNPWGALALWDPGNFGTGYENTLQNMGLNTLSGSPGAELASRMANKAFSSYLTSLFTGTGDPRNTQGAIGGFLSSGGQGLAGGPAAAGGTIRNLLNLHDTGNPQFLLNKGAEQFQQLLDNPNLALQYVAGLLGQGSSTQYLQRYLQQAAQYNAARAGNNASGPMDYVRSLLGMIPGVGSGSGY